MSRFKALDEILEGGEFRKVELQAFAEVVHGFLGNSACEDEPVVRMEVRDAVCDEGRACEARGPRPF